MRYKTKDLILRVLFSLDALLVELRFGKHMNDLFGYSFF